MDEEEIDKVKQKLNEEKKAIQDMMKWAEKINKKLMSCKSWETEIQEKLPAKLSQQKKVKFVASIPWLVFIAVGFVYALFMYVRKELQDDEQTSLPSGPYRRGLTWILGMMDGIFIATLVGTMRFLQLCMIELRRLEREVPEAIDKFRAQAKSFKGDADGDFAKAANGLKSLLRMLLNSRAKVDDTANKIHDKINGCMCRTLCGSMVKQMNTAEDEAMDRMKSGFNKMFTDEEIGEIVVEKEQNILDKVLTFEDQVLLPMEKTTSLHLISIAQKDAWLSLRLVISCQSILVFWTTLHFLDIVFFG